MDNRSASNSLSVCGSLTHSNQSRGRGHCARGNCTRSLCSFPNSRRRLKPCDLLNRTPPSERSGTRGEKSGHQLIEWHSSQTPFSGLLQASAWQSLVLSGEEKGPTYGKLGKKWGAHFDLSKIC